MSLEFKSTCDEAESFLNSEREYVENGLRVGFETFLNRLEVHTKLNQPILSDDDMTKIFSNYRTIYTANSKLFDDLMLLRLDGREKLRDDLGKCMKDFIPYFRIYTDYIVKKKSALAHLETLKKSNKKFRQFLKINETCAGRKLKSYLEEPAARLPQYLQHLAGVYVAFEHDEAEKNSEAGQLLLQAIIDIKTVTDEIAVKCRDLKARLLVGQLQKEVFGNKIQLLAAHRFCVSHAAMRVVVADKVKTHKIVLCNDILCVASMAGSFKCGQLLAVYPLIGLRVARDPKLSQALSSETTSAAQSSSSSEHGSTSLKHRFALVPQNKHFDPNTSSDMNSAYLGSLVLVCEDAAQLRKWIATIEVAVDEEEHNLKPCNPVDLEKRLRKQKTSKEGAAETIGITDEDKIREIEEWKLAKGGGLQRSSTKKLDLSVSRSEDDDKSSAEVADADAEDGDMIGRSASLEVSRAPPKKKTAPLELVRKTSSPSPRPPSRAPPTRLSLAVAPPNKPPPRRASNRKMGAPPRRPKAKSAACVSDIEPKDSVSAHVVANGPPPSKPLTLKTLPPKHGKATSNTETKPKTSPKIQPKPAPSTVAPPTRQVLKPETAKPSPKSSPKTKPVQSAKKDAVKSSPKTTSTALKEAPTDRPKNAKLRKADSRNNMLASIQGFSTQTSLKHVDGETLKKAAAENTQNVTNLLQATLQNYRQFVMDDDDSASDESDNDWDD